MIQLVYIITTSTYPSNKDIEVGRKYLEVIKKYPPDRTLSKQIVQAAVAATSDGISVIGIEEVKKGKYEEALFRVGRVMRLYADIEGFKYKVETRLTMAEAMSIVDLKPPE